MNFNYFISDTVGDFIIEAVDLVARYGHRLLTDYSFDPRSGHWRHRGHRSVARIDLTDVLSRSHIPGRAAGEDALAGYLDEAEFRLAGRPDLLDDGPSGLPSELEDLREFHLPASCVTDHSGGLQ